MDQVRSHNQSVVIKFLFASLFIYVLLGLFGGVPANANIGAFVIGLAILFVAVAGFLAIGWIAVIKPMPKDFSPSKSLPLPHSVRQGIALFLTLMSAIGIGGGLWDVTWHVRSGLPFGQDFFWRPHQFIYIALFAPIVVAGFICSRLLYNMTGTARQRLRADIPLTLIMLGGIAMLFILPADPVWHLIYGEDLTGLSVPHFTFSVSSTLTGIGSLCILLSYTQVRKTWGSIFNLRGVELLILLASAFTLISLMMPTIGDWEAITLPTSALPRLPALVAQRPDWALPFLATFVIIYPTSMALQIVKRFGAGTMVWVIAAIVRSGLFLAFGYANTGMASMFLFLPLVIALDVLTWYRTKRNQSVSPLLVASVCTVVGAVAVLPQIHFFFTDPILSAGNVIPIVIAMFAAAFVAYWMGTVLGDVVANTNRCAVPAGQPMIARSATRAMSVLTVAIVSIAVLFIITSTIPGLMQK